MQNCVVCSKLFEVTLDEINFIFKVSPEVNGVKYPLPLPQECPECRLVHRVIHRNEQNFYAAKSAKSGNSIVSMYAPDSARAQNYKVWLHEEWWSDDWDAMDYGQDFDFNRSFFEQFMELNCKIPRVNLVQVSNQNCAYTTGVAYSSNCHLISCSEYCEDCYYGKLIQNSRNIIDSNYVYDSELCYGCFDIKNCYNCAYVYYSQNSKDCLFSENLKGCSNCCLCTDLNNKEYYFDNKSCSKEEYEQKVAQLLGSHTQVQKTLEYLNYLRVNRVHKFANITNSEDSAGDFISNCRNCVDCYDINDSEDCKNVVVGVQAKDVMDCSNVYIKPELCYQVMGSLGNYKVSFCLYTFESSEVMYSQFVYNAANLFGCVGLRKKEYCILNKQYTKEEYETLLPQIIEYMKSTGEWGKMFLSSTSPFAYNETVAYEYMPLSREEALNRGYDWKDMPVKEITQFNYSVPDNLSEVADDIVNAVLNCDDCDKNYKIIKQELDKLRQFKLPIPRCCPACRHKRRTQLRNPYKLYDRQCIECGTAVKSTYGVDRTEKIYCEKCYLDAIY
jgi:hypothetical protein